MNIIFKNMTGLVMLSAMLFLTACAGLPPASGLTEAPPAKTRSSTPTSFLPISTVATNPVVMANGMVFQAVVVTKPSLCGDREVSTTSFVYGSDGQIVSSGTSSAAGANTCGKLAPSLATAGAAVVAATKVAGAVRYGSDQLSGAVRDGSATLADSVATGTQATADGLKAVGDGLTSNSDAMTNTLALMQCQALGVPSLIAACVAKIPQ